MRRRKCIYVLCKRCPMTHADERLGTFLQEFVSIVDIRVVVVSIRLRHFANKSNLTPCRLPSDSQHHLTCILQSVNNSTFLFNAHSRMFRVPAIPTLCLHCSLSCLQVKVQRASPKISCPHSTHIVPIVVYTFKFNTHSQMFRVPALPTLCLHCSHSCLHVKVQYAFPNVSCPRSIHIVPALFP